MQECLGLINQYHFRIAGDEFRDDPCECLNPITSCFNWQRGSVELSGRIMDSLFFEITA